MLVVTYDYAVVANNSTHLPDFKPASLILISPFIVNININPLFSAFPCQAPQILAFMWYIDIVTAETLLLIVPSMFHVQQGHKINQHSGSGSRRILQRAAAEKH